MLQFLVNKVRPIVCGLPNLMNTLIRMSDPGARAASLMEEGKKKLGGGGGFFAKMFGGGSSTEDAIDLFCQVYS